MAARVRPKRATKVTVGEPARLPALVELRASPRPKVRRWLQSFLIDGVL